MHLAYWIVAWLLALFNLYAGGRKVVQSRARLLPMMGWVEHAPMPAVRSIGGIEVLGAIGLVLPPLTGLAPGLAVAAALGFVVLQLGAVIVHLRRGESRLIALNATLVVVAAITAWLASGWV